MSQSIHQIIAGAGIGDAITNYSLEIQKILQSKGLGSILFSPDMHIAREFRETRAVVGLSAFNESVTSSDIVIYHYSMGSVATDSFVNSKCKKVLCYHNITPSKYFQNTSAKQASLLKEGRETLKMISRVPELALGVSNYNCEELREAGFSDPKVVPLIVPTDYLNTPPDSNFMERLSDGKQNILFVGRVVPNKRFEDLIKVFHYYKKFCTCSRLVLAGSYVGNEKYYTFLKSLVFDLGLTGSVFFTGHIRLSELIACYRSASAFLCVSEHEGFGLPLIEGMHFSIPVFGLNRAAVPETLGGAGVLFRDMEPLSVAALIHQVLIDKDLLFRVLERQKERLKSFTLDVLEERLLSLLQKQFPDFFIFDN